MTNNITTRFIILKESRVFFQRDVTSKQSTENFLASKKTNYIVVWDTLTKIIRRSVLGGFFNTKNKGELDTDSDLLSRRAELDELQFVSVANRSHARWDNSFNKLPAHVSQIRAKQQYFTHDQ